MNKFNLQLGKKNIRTFFAIPQSSQYQTINQLIVKPKSKIIRDEIWRNPIVFTDKKTNISFHQQPKIVKQKIKPIWTIQNYSPQLIKKYSYLLKPNRFINGQDLRIIKIVNDLKIISKNKKSLLIIIQAFYDHILSNLTYGKPIDGLYSYDQVLNEKVTDCGGFSSLLLSLLQSIKIPARLVVGFLIKHNSIFQNTLSMLHVSRYTFCDLLIHVWVEVLLPDKIWFPLDPAIEWRRSRGLTKRQGGFGIIPADRLVVSYGQDFKISRPDKIITVDLLQKPVNY